MATRFFFEGYTIEKDWQEMEVHYLVFRDRAYLFRLVAGEAGFELSAQEQALQKQVPAELIARLSDFIVRQED